MENFNYILVNDDANKQWGVAQYSVTIGNNSAFFRVRRWYTDEAEAREALRILQDFFRPGVIGTPIKLDLPIEPPTIFARLAAKRKENAAKAAAAVKADAKGEQSWQKKAKPGKKKRVMSAEGRANIIAAQKKRWAAAKKGKVAK